MSLLSSLSLFFFGTTKTLPSIEIQFINLPGYKIEKVCYRYGQESIPTKEVCSNVTQNLNFTFEKQKIRYWQGFDHTSDPFVDIVLFTDDGKSQSIPYDTPRGSFIKSSKSYDPNGFLQDIYVTFDLDKYEKHKNQLVSLSKTDYLSLFLSIEFVCKKRLDQLLVTELLEYVKNGIIQDVYIYSNSRKAKGDEVIQKNKAFFSSTDYDFPFPKDLKNQRYIQWDKEEKLSTFKKKYPNGLYNYSLNFFVITDSLDESLKTPQDAIKIEQSKYGLKQWQLTLKGFTNRPLKPFYKDAIRYYE